jgi:hypothetical protein
MAGARTATKRLFKMIPRGTNLEDEIAIVRLRCTELREMLNEGQLAIQVGCGKDGEGRAALIEDLLAKELGILNALVRTQAENHPERRVGGGMTLTVKIEGTTAAQLDVDDALDADGQKELPPGEQTVESSLVGALDEWDP